jgi:lipoprotein-anchoring transpeptidase ErfK/SrfK
MPAGSPGAHARPAVRRIPTVLTIAALVVLLVAALGAKGVITAPDAAGSVPHGSSASAKSDLAAATTPTHAVETPAATATTAAVTTPSAATTPAAEAVADVSDDVIAGAPSPFAAALGIFFDALAEPAQDTVAPVQEIDKAKLPRATVNPADDVLPADSGSGKRIVYAKGAQRVWLVEADGTVTRTYRVSGRMDRPDPGTYQVYSKSQTAVSYDYKETMEYMVRFAHGRTAAIGFHDIPRDKAGNEVQTTAQLGEPISAGCVRQADADAVALWDWAPVGTTVVVIA